MVAEKSRLKFSYSKTSFSTCSLPKTLIKHLRNHDEPIHDLKTPKNCPKN
jgi:hypothetical protein